MAGSANYLYTEEIYSTQLGTMVVITTPWASVSDEDKALLAKILGSVKLTTDAVHIVTFTEIDFEKLTGYKGANILNFGAATRPDIPPYTPTAISEFNVITADKLTQLDDAKKKQLWQALKLMYKV